jgi:hypothetical protein
MCLIDGFDYEDVYVSIGQEVEYIDGLGKRRAGKILSIDQDKDTVYVSTGFIIKYMEEVHANNLIVE